MRGDLPPGKAAAQAIHGALQSFSLVPSDIAEAYLVDGHGPVIVLTACGEHALRSAYEAAQARQLPCALFIDERADGTPTVTAVGLGPVLRDEALPITDGMPLMK